MILRCVFRSISFPSRAGVFPGIRCRELRIVGILGIWKGGARKGEGRGKSRRTNTESSWGELPDLELIQGAIGEVYIPYDAKGVRVRLRRVAPLTSLLSIRK